MTNIYTRLKNLDFMLKPEALPKGSKNPKGNLYENVDPEDKEKWLTPNEQKTWDKEEREWAEDSDRVEEIDSINEHPNQKGSKKRRKKLTQEQEKVERDRKATGSQPANPTKKKAVITNIYSRLKSLDFMLRGAPVKSRYRGGPGNSQNRKRQAEDEHSVYSLGDTSSRSPTKKDGEFGGMNTGEVEWTEPRDTANSRTKRDKDVA